MDLELLMALQYSLPLTTTPLEDLADHLGREYEDVERKIREYIEQGIVKRYGLNLNYRAFSSVKRAALVGFKTENIENVAKVVNEFDEVTVKHNFLRDAEYKVWFTIKGEGIDEIKARVAEIAKRVGVRDYVVLPTKRVYKMDVKYDLYKGISWSNRGLEPEKVPFVRDLGLSEEFVRALESLEVCRRPFSKFGNEEEVVSIVEELIKKGVGRDFSGVLRESKIGFKENGMVVLKTNYPEKVALYLLDNYPQITHLIERIPDKNWNYPLYFMVHAVKKEPIESIRDEVSRLDGVVEARVVYSKKNLREV